MEAQILLHIELGTKYLEEGDFSRAEDQYHKLLKLQPNNAKAHLGLLMVAMRAKKIEDLAKVTRAIDRDEHYLKAYEHGDDTLREQLTRYAAMAKETAAEVRYERAMDFFDNATSAADYKDAAYWFSAALKYVPDYMDAEERMKDCRLKFALLTAPTVPKKTKPTKENPEESLEADVYAEYLEQTKKLEEAKRAQAEEAAAKNAGLQSNPPTGKKTQNTAQTKDDSTKTASSDSTKLTKEEKKGCIGCLAIILGIVAVVLFIVFGIPQIRFQNAVKMFESGDEAWVELVEKLKKQDEMIEYIDQQADALVEAGEIDSALDLMKQGKKIDGLYWQDVDALAGEYALIAYEQGDYALAWSRYDRMSEPPINDEAYLYTNFMLGLQNREKGDFENDSQAYMDAVMHFRNCEQYYDVAEQRDFCMYRYVQLNPDQNNNTTVAYLEDLMAIDYKDISTLYHEIYFWSIEPLAVNTVSDSSSENYSVIGLDDPLYFHFRLVGGSPGATLLMKTKYYLPDGRAYEYEWTNAWETNTYLWFGWPDGIAKGEELTTAGEVMIEFFDDLGNMIGSMTVNVE